MRTSLPCAAYWFAMWVLSPLGWPADFVIIDILTGGMGVDDPSMTPRYIGIALAVPPTWLLWRTLSRYAIPLHDGSGLKVRSWFRTYAVPWGRVRDVEGLELYGSRLNVRFSQTAVTFEADRLRRVVVSMSWRSGSAGAMTIRSWAPPNHWLRHDLPRDLRDATPGADQEPEDWEAPTRPDEAPEPIAETPAHASDGCEPVKNEPVTETLMPSARSRRQLATTLGVAALVVTVMGLFFSADGTAVGLGFGIAMWVCALVALFAAMRALRMRVELTGVGIVIHGLLMTSVFSRSEIADIVVSDSGSGPTPRLILTWRGSRALAPGMSFRTPDEAVLGRLRQWLRDTEHAVDTRSTPG